MKIDLSLKILNIFFLLTFIFSGCSNQAESSNSDSDGINETIIVATSISTQEPTETPSEPTASPTLPLPSATPTPDWEKTPDPRGDAKYWRTWPIIPDQVSDRAKQIYFEGIANGRDPNRFSKLGDCQSLTTMFFGIFDNRPDYYLTIDVNENYPELTETINSFSGSFGRDSAAVTAGISVNSALSPLWSRDPACNSNENPVECEIRLNNPSILIISLGTNWTPNAEVSFDKWMRQIVDYSISQGVLPVMVTKADNIEQNNALNQVMAQIAIDYRIPLWNFWAAVQHLPNHGIDPQKVDGLTYLVPNAWDIKSFTGLQAIDAIWRLLNE